MQNMMMRHAVAACVLLCFLLDVTVAMKCVLQSRQLLNPGWWNLVQSNLMTPRSHVK